MMLIILQQDLIKISTLLEFGSEITLVRKKKELEKKKVFLGVNAPIRDVHFFFFLSRKNDQNKFHFSYIKTVFF